MTGAVVASRLSEMEDWNVLLLEAGGDGSAVYDIPSRADNLQLTKIDWEYTTEPNNIYCRGKSCRIISTYKSGKYIITRTIPHPLIIQSNTVFFTVK